MSSSATKLSAPALLKWSFLLGCVHTESKKNLLRDKVTHRVNGKMQIDALLCFIASSVSIKTNYGTMSGVSWGVYRVKNKSIAIKSILILLIIIIMIIAA